MSKSKKDLVPPIILVFYIGVNHLMNVVGRDQRVKELFANVKSTANELRDRSTYPIEVIYIADYENKSIRVECINPIKLEANEYESLKSNIDKVLLENKENLMELFLFTK